MKNKNLLAENMLRFRAKNLSETAKRKIVKLAEIITEQSDTVNFSDLGERIFEAAEPPPSFSQNPNVTEKYHEDENVFFKYYGGKSGNLESLIGKTVHVFRNGPTAENPAYMNDKNLVASFVVKQIETVGNSVKLGSETKTKVNPQTRQEETTIDHSKPFIRISDANLPTISYYPDYKQGNKVYNVTLQNYVMLKAFNKQRGGFGININRPQI